MMIRTLPRLGLFLFALIPVLIGAAILVSMQGEAIDAIGSPADVIRRASYPWAITAHILGGSAMLVLGFGQFSTHLRRRFPLWHRWIGRALIGAGLFVALSSLWMNAADMAKAESGLYDTAQNLMAVLFLVMLGRGLWAIRRGQLAQHRVWMMRAYAITLGAATQTVLLLPVVLITGEALNGLWVDLVSISAWFINLGVAEIILRRPVKAMTESPRRGLGKRGEAEWEFNPTGS